MDNFICGYLTLSSVDGNLAAEPLKELIEKHFPRLQPFLAAQRSSRDSVLDPTAFSADYDTLSYHMKILTTTDWLALFRISELEEKRRGRAIRYVLMLIHDESLILS